MLQIFAHRSPYSPAAVIPNPTLAASTADHHRRRVDTPRWAMAISFILSLLLHGYVFLALFDTERPLKNTSRATVVSVYLVESRPTAPSSAAVPRPPSPPAVAEASRGEAKELRPQGKEPPGASGKSITPSTVPKRIASMSTSPDAQTHVAPRPATAAPARSAETPGNRAYNSPSEYLRLLALRLAEVKRYPAAAVARREEGVVLLAFRLDRSGHILSWEIARSSGHDELDAEVSRMVAQAAPFPPFPAAWRETAASFQVPIGFSLY